jgi:hypothetical protein
MIVMKFILLIWDNKETHAKLSPSEFSHLVEEHKSFTADLTAHKKLIDGQPFRPAAEGIRVTMQRGKRTVKGLPTEAPEVLGGYYLLDCETKEEAIEQAKNTPLESDAIEVREILMM